MPRVLPKNIRDRYYTTLYKENPNREVSEYVKLAREHFSTWEEGTYRTSSAQYEREIRNKLNYYKQLK